MAAEKMSVEKIAAEKIAAEKKKSIQEANKEWSWIATRRTSSLS